MGQYLSLYTQKSEWIKEDRCRGGGGGGSGELTELDFDILGRESANIEPVKVEDSDIVFGEEIVVTTTPTIEGKLITVPFYMIQLS